MYEHVRPEPEGWQNLLDIATDLSTAGLPPVTANRTLCEQLDGIDDEPLSLFFYHALGRRIAASLAPALAEPANQQATVTEAARAMQWSAHVMHGGQLRFADIRSQPTAAYFTRLSAPDSDHCSSEQRAESRLTDALDVVVTHHRGNFGRPRADRMPVSEWPEDKLAISDLAARRIGLNVLAAALGMSRRALMHMAQARPTDDGPIRLAPYEEMVVNRALSRYQVRQLDISSAATWAASLRMDEFMHALREWNAGSMLWSTSSGQVYLDTAKRPRVPHAIHTGEGPRDFVHEERLKCPALFVRGFARSTAQMTPRIVEAAAYDEL